MSESVYLTGLLGNYRVNVAAAESAGNTLYPVLQQWGGNVLLKAEFSGSLAKGTGINTVTDADIFLSISSDCTSSLSQIYDSLYNAVTGAGYSARKQNVSIGTTVNGYKIDLVPGKRQSQWGSDHSLYKSKSNSWTKTNIYTHINQVKNSGRINEIRLAKIWRECHGLQFPSFYLELVVIEACKYATAGNYTNNYLKVLEYIRDSLLTTRFLDPANTNNIISDEITLTQKRQIARQAGESRNKQYWSEIVW